LALPLASLAVAGCGGGGSGGTTSTPVTTTPTTTALSKAELIEQGDAICAEVNAAVGTVGSSSSEASKGTSQVADLYSGMVQSLKGLGTPQEAAGYSEFSSAADKLATAEGEVKLASERGDEAALTTAESSASSALSSFKAAAQEYGFQKCAEGPSAPTSGSAGTTTPSEAAPEETPETAEPEAEPEAAPEVAPETGGAGGAAEGAGGGTGGGAEGGGGGSGGGGSGGIGPG
jgi:hypothetical protein